ncbi:MAG: amidase [Nitriliruptoraceae bacterium]
MIVATGPDARQIVASIGAGETTAEAVTTTCLERIVADESALRAWAHVDPERALFEARDRDAASARGPLHGVPVGVKDIIDTGDQPTAYGSPIYANHRPDVDAAVVQRLRAAGAVILGKTVTTEFALFTPGPTVNPYDDQRTPGGSSSGSAAAVAAGMVPLALGTQTAGSVIRPASFCGVFGIKPTFGRVPTAGVKACAPSLDTVGAFARTADDLALVTDVLLGPDPAAGAVDTASDPRVGWCPGPHWDAIAPEIQQRLLDGVATLRRALDVHETALPGEFAGLTDAQVTIMAHEVDIALTVEQREHAARLSSALVDYLIDARDAADGYEAAVRLAEQCRSRIDEAFGDADVLLTPSVLGEAPLKQSTGDPLLCRMWTLLGVPAVAIPGLTGPHGLPLGIQVVARPGADRRAIEAAGRIAAAISGE